MLHGVLLTVNSAISIVRLTKTNSILRFAYLPDREDIIPLTARNDNA